MKAGDQHATVELHWQHRKWCDEKSESRKSTKFRVWDKASEEVGSNFQAEEPLFLEIPESHYNVTE